MASGCAVILSDKVGGAVDLIRDGQNGLIFPSGEITGVAALITRLLNHREALERMKTASRALIGDFSYEKIILAIENVIT
jgi:glycosyltransferase involved in cell wall biosynthesis